MHIRQELFEYYIVRILRRRSVVDVALALLYVLLNTSCELLSIGHQKIGSLAVFQLIRLNTSDTVHWVREYSLHVLEQLPQMILAATPLRKGVANVQAVSIRADMGMQYILLEYYGLKGALLEYKIEI